MAHMARPRTELDDGKILALAKTGMGGREIAAKLRAEGGRASDRTVCRRLAEIAPQVRADRAASVAKAAKALPPPKPPTPVEAHTVESPPADAPRGNLSAAERQVDGLLARSPVWRRIQTAIASSLATHPDAAAAVARALREVTL